MSAQIIGRNEELHTLNQFLKSDSPEFLAIYGRRRVGKTFLIRHFFEGKNAIFFDITGAKNAPMSEQTRHFTQQIGKVFYNGAKLAVGKNWDETFQALTDAIEAISGHKKIVLFLTNFPGWQPKTHGYYKILNIIGISIGRKMKK